MAAVAGADGDGEEREVGLLLFGLRELFGEGGKSRFGGAVAAGESEGPIENDAATVEPAVAPRVGGKTGGGVGSSALISPREHCALFLFEVLI